MALEKVYAVVGSEPSKMFPREHIYLIICKKVDFILLKIIPHFSSTFVCLCVSVCVRACLRASERAFCVCCCCVFFCLFFFFFLFFFFLLVFLQR